MIWIVILLNVIALGLLTYYVDYKLGKLETDLTRLRNDLTGGR